MAIAVLVVYGASTPRRVSSLRPPSGLAPRPDRFDPAAHPHARDPGRSIASRGGSTGRLLLLVGVRLDALGPDGHADLDHARFLAREPSRVRSPGGRLKVWLSNNIAFALLYWTSTRRPDRARQGAARATRTSLSATDQTRARETRLAPGVHRLPVRWIHHRHAFSPTDTMPMAAARRSPMPSQALISFTIVGLVPRPARSMRSRRDPGRTHQPQGPEAEEVGAGGHADGEQAAEQDRRSR